jgi:hypothetical protein
MAPGTPWTWRWSVDGNPLFEGTQPWAGIAGSPFWMGLEVPDRFPDGSYKLELLVEDVLMGQATAKVGLGQLPVNIFTTSTGVQLQGQVLDAETRRGIPGVMFLVLKNDMTTRDFTWQMSDVSDTSITDSEGNFQLSRLLPRGQSYSFLVVAQGYLPVSTDGLRIDDRTKNPFVLTIELNRD